MVISFVILIYFANQNLGQSKSLVTQAISRGINLDINFDSADIDWFGLLQLKPAIAIKKLRIANPRGYLNPDFLQAKELRAQISIWKLLWRKIYINKIEIKEAVIALEQNNLGQKNFNRIIEKLNHNPSPITYQVKSKTGNNSEDKLIDFSIETIELDEFLIKQSKISLVSYVQGGQFNVFDINNVNIKSRGFSTDKVSEILIEAAVFDTSFPVLRYKATIGPVYKESIKTHGKLELVTKLKDIPRNSRKKYFGNLIAEPGPDDIITLEVNLSGDLLHDVQGDGFLSFKDIHSGQSRDDRIIVNGLMPITISLSSLTGQPKLNIISKDASLKIAEHSLIKFDYTMLSIESRTSIASKGSIQGLDINQFLTAYTKHKNKLSGKFTIPDFNIKLNGSDANEMITSLDGFGSIHIANGSLVILEKIYKLKGLLANYAELQTQLKNTDSNSFISLDSTFRIENRKLKNDSVKIVTPALTFYGSGELGFDNQLNYHFVTKVLTREIPLHISGTVDKPKLALDAKQFTINELEKQFKPFWDSLLPKNDD